MRELTAVWQNLEPRRRLIVALATVAMFAAVIALAKVATRPSMAVLYAGLDGARAGDVLAALDQQGAPYEVRGTAIYVESPRRLVPQLPANWQLLRETQAGEVRAALYRRVAPVG